MNEAVNSFDSSSYLDFLADEGLLPRETCLRVAHASEETGTSAEKAVLELGLLEEEEVYNALARHLGVPFCTFDAIDQDLAKSNIIPRDYMTRATVVPIAKNKEGFVVAISDPNFRDTAASLSYLLDQPVACAIATPTTIKTALDLARTDEGDAADAADGSDIARLQALANDGPVIALVSDIISKGVALGASDIHIEAMERGARVRYRVDGALQMDRQIPDGSRNAVASRLKIMANLNISEKRRPQDGRADTVVRGRGIDIRLSTIPTQFGESIVLRLLDRSRVQLDWDTLRFPPERVAEIEKLTSHPNGIFLVAGPTGSGKTTTLYTALRGLNAEDRKIVTVEDPIEYRLGGVNQVQVDPGVNMSFATALRAILRQDPNVVMVGEIRDEETAAIAVRAALIGRLVLSTIHTNDAVGAVDRLLDLGVPPYMVGATLRGVLSQRLVRANCRECGGGGCDSCRQSGLQGRLAISELLHLTPAVSEAIIAGARGVQLRSCLKDQGFRSIRAHAEDLVASGEIARAEAHKTLGLDD